MTAVLQAVTTSFSVLRNRNFRIYLGGQAVSLVGTWLQITAQNWVVWQLTGDTEALGITSMLSGLPLLIFGPWAGSWADRYNRRRLLIGTQITAMLLAFILAFLVLTGTVQLIHVYILALILGIVTAIDMPAQQAFIGDLAGTDEVRQAVNVNVMIVQLSRLIGPAIAGMIIAAYGAGTTFFINGLSFSAVVLSLMMVSKAKLTRSGASNNNALRGLWEAVQYIRRRPALVDWILFLTLLMFFGMATIVNILPAVVTDVLHGDASLLGLMMSATGGGALIGTIIIAPWVQTVRRTGVVLSFFMVCVALCFVLLAVSTTPALSLLAVFLSGIASPPVFSTVMGLLQFGTPPEMRARVTGLSVMVSFGLQPLAALWIGWNAAANNLGIERAILLDASLLLAGSILMLARTARRKVNPITLPHDAENIPLTELI